MRGQGGLHEEPLFRIRVRADSVSALLNVGQIQMIEPIEKEYTVVIDRDDMDRAPHSVPSAPDFQFFDYIGDDKHIAAQLREGRSVKVHLEIPYIARDGSERRVPLDTLVSPAQ